MLLERESELAAVRALLDAATAGTGAAASVVGPAGIGKTSLLRAARELAGETGLRVLSARGGELERDFAYGVVRQLVERRVRELPPAERATVLEGAAGVAASVLGLEGEAADSSFAVLHALYWVCANLADDRPLLLLVDDAHWADDASLRFLVYLQRRLEELPIVVLSAARPVVEAPRAELIEQLTAAPGVTQLTPAPLSAAAVAALLGETADPQFVAACHSATAGNPFLCETLVAAVRAAGVEPLAREAPRVTELAAGAVAGDVVRRMGQVPAEAATLARAVAILGTRVALRHAAALSGLDEIQAAGAASALAGQGLLRGAAQLDFVHPLLRAAVREQVPAPERAQLHGRAAALLDADGVAPQQIAMHLLAAAPAGSARAVATLRAAARAAHGDPVAAVRLLRRALEEPPPAGERVALLHDLALAELYAGQPEAAEAHLAEAHALAGEDVELRAAIAREHALALRILRRYAESTAAIMSAIDDLREREPDHALALTSELFQTAMMDPTAYRAVCDRIGDDLDGEVTGVSRGERAYLAALATEAALRSTGSKRVRAWGATAAERGLVAEDAPHSGLWANVAFPVMFADGFEIAARLCDDALARGRRLGSPTAIARAHVARAMLHLRAGDVREAEADARTGIEIGRDAALHVLPMGVAGLVEALVARGELDAADVALEEAGSTGPLPESFLVTWTLEARGVLRLAQGRVDEAVADLEEVGRRGREGWRSWNPAMFRYRTPLAIAALRRGDADRARALADEQLELAQRWGAPRAIGGALCTRGIVAASLDQLHEAVDVLAESGATLEHARALVELGAAIARSGRRVDARERLHAGMELAHRCGATALSARAREELVATGARPRRVMRTGVDALTPSELRVARMAADGMTNREIAQALFVTLRTVEVHLTHCYQKLDIASREELPASLAP